MSQAERDEEAAAVLEYEALRAEGVSLADIGAGRVKVEKVDGEIQVQHVNNIEEDLEGAKPSTASEKV